MGSTLLTLGAVAWVALIVFVVWSYRRKAAERESARAERYQAFIGATMGSGAATTLDAARIANAMLAAAGAASGRPPVDAAVAAPPLVAAGVDVATFRRRERLLDASAAAMYLTLRAAVPDHPVFARTSLADLLDVGEHLRGYERETRVRRLQPLTVDFVVCNKALQPVAVVDLEDPARPVRDAQEARLKADYLRAFGIRRLVFRRDALPKYPQLREQLLASPTSTPG